MTGKFWYCRTLLIFNIYLHALQELHAEQVESTLLSQVRVASVGQEIDVWVLGRTRIRLRVGTSPLALPASTGALITLIQCSLP